MDDIMQAQLFEILNNGKIDTSETGDIEVESIGGGRFQCTLPDGRIIFTDQFGNIVD